ncbi:50S ribosomal protein L15 [Enhygromyxa salina]|uniref:Large ribosomal subunit protein uL15 n=1 Tax=Enhygromyxa salina TaxID=215803 RepID=A0A2S9XQ98_9BACT|nr:50S ribosomal protein L15 [Enhygromyxa salina]PRP95042.1 50S ribosomal protein L15 [Enhygromyxa salina]
MGTELHTLQPPAGARHRKKRIGRGPGSGNGKTAGRGSKGTRKRNTVAPGFEGGQLPIHRRVPKRGFVNIHRVEVHGVNVGRLDNLEDGTVVTPALLHQLGYVPKKATIIKVLADGELSKKLTIRVHRISGTARAKIEGAGGTIELIESAKPDA